MEQTQQTTPREAPTLLGCKVQEMDEKQTQLFMALTMSANHPIIGGLASEKEAEEIGLLAQIMFNYIKVSDLQITNGLMAWLSMITDRPGHTALWVTTLLKMAKEHPADHVLNLMDWTYKFPEGVPTAAEYERVYDEAKAVSYENEKHG